MKPSNMDSSQTSNRTASRPRQLKPRNNRPKRLPKDHEQHDSTTSTFSSHHQRERLNDDGLYTTILAYNEHNQTHNSSQHDNTTISDNDTHNQNIIISEPTAAFLMAPQGTIDQCDSSSSHIPHSHSYTRNNVPLSSHPTVFPSNDISEPNMTPLPSSTALSPYSTVPNPADIDPELPRLYRRAHTLAKVLPVPDLESVIYRLAQQKLVHAGQKSTSESSSTKRHGLKTVESSSSSSMDSSSSSSGVSSSNDVLVAAATEKLSTDLVSPVLVPLSETPPPNSRSVKSAHNLLSPETVKLRGPLSNYGYKSTTIEALSTCRRLFIGQIPPNMLHRDLFFIFQQFGTVEELVFLQSKDSLTHTGSALCTYYTHDDARKAVVGLDGKIRLPGAKRPLLVRLSPRSGAYEFIQSTNSSITKLFVSNVPSTASPSDITSLFSLLDPHASLVLLRPELNTDYSYAIIAIRRTAARAAILSLSGRFLAGAQDPVVVSEMWYHVFILQQGGTSPNANKPGHALQKQQIQQILQYRNTTQQQQPVVHLGNVNPAYLTGYPYQAPRPLRSAPYPQQSGSSRRHRGGDMAKYGTSTLPPPPPPQAGTPSTSRPPRQPRSSVPPQQPYIAPPPSNDTRSLGGYGHTSSSEPASSSHQQQHHHTQPPQEQDMTPNRYQANDDSHVVKVLPDNDISSIRQSSETDPYGSLPTNNHAYRSRGNNIGDSGQYSTRPPRRDHRKHQQQQQQQHHQPLPQSSHAQQQPSISQQHHHHHHHHHHLQQSPQQQHQQQQHQHRHQNTHYQDINHHYINAPPPQQQLLYINNTVLSSQQHQQQSSASLYISSPSQPSSSSSSRAHLSSHSQVLPTSYRDSRYQQQSNNNQLSSLARGRRSSSSVSSTQHSTTTATSSSPAQARRTNRLDDRDISNQQ